MSSVIPPSLSITVINVMPSVVAPSRSVAVTNVKRATTLTLTVQQL